jgi:3-oxoacyl-[acyl-carrier-protein] synthase III
MRTYIESIGVYLPERVVTLDEVVEGCAHPLHLPLSQLTGIRSRRRTGDDEDTISMAAAAARDCLSHSQSSLGPDLVIACHIARVEGPAWRLTIEPSTAIRIAHQLGWYEAAAFDVSNACAGTFTGILLADILIKAEYYRRVLVVSGEFITHITDVAQRSVTGPADPQVASLTLGDAAVACLIEPTDRDDLGFRAIDLRTRPEFVDLCTAGPADDVLGGFAMRTQAVRLAAVSIQEGTQHALATLARNGLTVRDIDRFVLHQTSRTSLTGAIAHVNATVGEPIVQTHQVVDNLTERGNTASTTHLLAVAEAIERGDITTGQRLLFGITGSGLTVGTAIYDHGDRSRPEPRSARSSERIPPGRSRLAGWSAALAEPRDFNGISAAAAAVDMALRRADVATDDIDLLIHAGVYRSDLVYEPTVAARVAAALTTRLPGSRGQQGPLCFDVNDGALGFLRSCFLGERAVSTGRARAAVVVTAEVDNHADGRAVPLGITTGAAAVVLELSNSTEGFVRFAFSSRPTPLRWRHVGAETAGTIEIVAEHDERIAEAYAEAVLEAVKSLGTSPAEASWVLSPFASSELSQRCRAAIDVPRPRWIEVDTAPATDAVTLAMPLGLATLDRRPQPGDVMLILGAGSGISAGAALYQW